ncbi:MAG: hypothetical protein U9R36_00470 [Elusimicrobiota bacterium]|nr:hypothetical protein [Elusimicrobiota bacterium]
MRLNTDKIYNRSLNLGVILLAMSITFSITFMNVAFILFLLAFVIKLFKKDIHYISTGLELPVGLFLGLYVISALISGKGGAGVKQVLDNYWYILHMYVVVYLFGETHLRKFVKVLGWSAFAIAVFTIFQSLVGLNFTLDFNINSTFKFSPPELIKFIQLGKYPVYTGTGIMGHIRHAGQLLMLLFFTFAAFKKKWPAAAVFLALILSFAYSCWIGFLAAVLIYLYFKRKSYIFATAIFVALLLAVVYFPGVQEKVKKEISEGINYTKASMAMVIEKPFFSADMEEYSEKTRELNSALADTDSPKSVYMNILTEGGIFVFIVFLYLIYSFCRHYVKAPPSLKERWRDLRTASWLALIAIFIAGFFYRFLIYAENSVLIWTLAGIIIKINKSKWTSRLVSPYSAPYHQK